MKYKNILIKSFLTLALGLTSGLIIDNSITSVNATSIIVNEIEFTNILEDNESSFNNLTSGNYYLNSDIDLSSTTYTSITIKNGETVNICLNSHLIKGNYYYSVFNVEEGATLNIYDYGNTTYTWSCNSSTKLYTFDNTITSSDDNYRETTGGVIYYGNGAFDIEGTVNFYGGNVVGNAVFKISDPNLCVADMNGNLLIPTDGIFYIHDNGCCTMYDGLIAGNYASSVYLENTATFIMNGGIITESYGLIANNASTLTINDGQIYNNKNTYQINCKDSSILNLYGGEIYSTLASPTAYGINVNHYLHIKGCPKVYDNKTNSSIEININISTLGSITLDDLVTSGAELNLYTTKTISNLINNVTQSDLDSYITIDNPRYRLVKNSSSDTYNYYIDHAVYSITYELDGGRITQYYPNNYECNSITYLPTEVEKSGLTFVGWYEESDFSGSMVTYISENDYGNKTYYAKYICRISDYEFSNTEVYGCDSRYPIYPNENEYARFYDLSGPKYYDESTGNINTIDMTSGQYIKLELVNNYLYDLETDDYDAYYNIYWTLKNLSNLSKSEIINATVFKLNLYNSNGTLYKTLSDYGIIFGYDEDYLIYYSFNSNSMRDGGLATLLTFKQDLMSSAESGYTFSYITPSSLPMNYSTYLTIECDLNKYSIGHLCSNFGGTLKDSSNNPIANTSVTVYINGSGHNLITTDSYGNFNVQMTGYYSNNKSYLTYTVTDSTNTYTLDKYYYVFSLFYYDIYNNKLNTLYSTVASYNEDIVIPSISTSIYNSRMSLLCYYDYENDLGDFSGYVYLPADEYTFDEDACNEYISSGYKGIYCKYDYINKLFTGTDITGTDTVTGSIDDVLEGDTYLNTSTYNLYEFSQNQWVYKSNLKGEKGDKGDTGEQGEKGDTGATGKSIESISLLSSVDNVDTYIIHFSDSSYTTFTVTNGVDGADGQNGVDGANGADGTNGSTPTISIDAEGYWVINGETSSVKATGLKGDTGEQGETGITPQLQINSMNNIWEVSYDNGEHWTSLGIKASGEQGEKGDTGEKGEKGDTGETGRSLVSIEKTSSLNNVDTYTINYSDGTSSTYTVTNGINGEDGQDGANGINGISSTVEIDDDGYWIINGERSDVKAAGLNGVNGSDGTNGITPTLRINSETNYWEVSYNNGTSWTSLNVKATGEAGKSVVSISKTATDNNIDTYTITYSDNSTSSFNITNGYTPTITIDDNNYWVIDGITSTVKATGNDGKTPTLRVNSLTNYWEISYDNGTTWSSIGVKYEEGSVGNSTAVSAGVVTSIFSLSINIVFVIYFLILYKKKKLF